MTMEEELKKQSSGLRDASTKLIENMIKFAKESGKLEGMRLTGEPSDVQLLHDHVKLSMKAAGEVIDWTVKLTLLNMELLQFICNEATKE